MLLALTRSAFVNPPPTYRSLPNAASAFTWPLVIPSPKADQRLPFHWAMLLATTPPAVMKDPPADTLLPDTASAYTKPFTPDPSADQLLPFHLAMPTGA